MLFEKCFLINLRSRQIYLNPDLKTETEKPKFHFLGNVEANKQGYDQKIVVKGDILISSGINNCLNKIIN